MAPVDRGKLRSHVDFVRSTVRKLEQIRADGRDAFMSDEVAQAAATRWLQTAVEALIDMANHVIAREGLGVPRAYSDSMEILVRERILPAERRDTLLAMVRFRNRAVHLYDKVGADEVWRILQEDLGDFDVFIRAIVVRYFAD
ncbi:MAG: DUF86 domain-containing protein [Acidobacteriota bacterium]